MNYNDVLAAARGQIGPYCKACPVCDGRACGYQLPGPGTKYPGRTATRNYEKWQEILINMDTLVPNADPDVTFELFGHTFAAPIFAAPLGGMKNHYGEKYTDQEYNAILVPAAVNYGLMAFLGDNVDPQIMQDGIEECGRNGGMGCPTIKPWAKEVVFEKLDAANAHGLFACAMDVDGAGLPFLRAMNGNAGSKSVAEMREIIEYAKMPFIIKGIMTPVGARKAVEAGAAGIVVSNHGGRVQGGVPSTAEVLPAIVDAVKGETVIFVDGGIRSGVDVFRALALGADAVLIGRPVTTAIYGAGEEGFRVYMDKIVGELKSTMTMCGAANLADVTREKLWL